MNNKTSLRPIDQGGTHVNLELPRGPILFVCVLLLLVVVAILAAPVPASAEVSVGISVSIGPPAIPVYTQPPVPGPGFIWMPGYWAWDLDFGYYWIPGVWVPAPFIGALWTPGYWAWGNGVYMWNEGYWGPVVGFYGGINYGFGYTGYGYYGGYWSGGSYYYNRRVNNIRGTEIRTVYSKPVRNVRPAGPSFHGGRGGTSVQPTADQLAAPRQQRSSLTREQRRHIEIARTDTNQRASLNRGRPAIAATPKPGQFKGRGVIGARRAGAPYKAPEGRQAAPRERVQTPRPDAAVQPPSTGPGRVAPRTPQGAPERKTPGIQRQQHERVAPQKPRQGPGGESSEPLAPRERKRPAQKEDDAGERRGFR